ncbi:hypothetical protein BBI15_15065 [Planococcus plakortidis]|uniref:Uncharacterized protein n=1 Tax=Planococcus plakortidis TaxID=1038856 RepID=A0A1C7EBR4_9BACL|nr:hypothetical protein [Planococcus plakortidis]ANU21404.1 hypothetical protein BBI15_15065 [Planococcus plakortidis]
MNWPEIKEYLTEPIISKQKDPLLIFPLGVLAAWAGTMVYRSSGITYFEYLQWMIPVAILAFALYFLLIAWLKKQRAKNNLFYKRRSPIDRRFYYALRSHQQACKTDFSTP